MANQKKMTQHREKVTLGNLQQFLEPSKAFKRFISHNRNLDGPVVKVGYHTHGWHNSDYWLPLLMTEEGVVFLEGGKGCNKFIAGSLKELKSKIESGQLKFCKLLEV